jgi:hypothetical protein
MQTRTCRHCRRFTYQPCWIACEFTMSPHCAKWHTCFPDASGCQNFEREPGSDDELAGAAAFGSAPARPAIA